jgi:F0F1-type ATP synthase epsilon subunit
MTNGENVTLVVNEALWLDEIDSATINSEIDKVDKEIDNEKSEFQINKLVRIKKFWEIAKENN